MKLEISGRVFPATNDVNAKVIGVANVGDAFAALRREWYGRFAAIVSDDEMIIRHYWRPIGSGRWLVLRDEDQNAAQDFAALL